MRFVVVAAVGGVGACSHYVKTTEEVPVGTCASLAASSGGTCRRGTLDYAGYGMITISGPEQDIGMNGGGRWRIMEAGLDYRGMRRTTDPVDPNAYTSGAGYFGLHVSPTAFLPPLHRYLDLAMTAGIEGGVIDRDGVVKGRGGGYLGASAELSLPDVLGFAYEREGVPALHLGVRRTYFVEGWNTTTTYEIGLAWRWGKPIEFHRYTYFKPALD